MPKAMIILGLGVVLFAGPAAQAQTGGAAYPTRAVKIIVGFAPGGGTDLVARVVAQKLQESLGQNVFIENRPGGNGQLAPDLVSKSTPDGYTLLFGASGQMAVTPAVYQKLPYQPLKDFVPISMMSSYPLIMVISGNHPAKNISEFVTWAKANPDKVNYGSTSPAFVLTSEMFKLRTGTAGQAIPFKSNNESVTSVIADQVTYVIAEPPPLVPQVASGKARALAVASDVRLPELPDVPTMKEAGVDMKVVLWLGLFAPAGTPTEIVKKLEAECQRIAQMPDFKQRLRAMSTDSIGSSSAEFVKLIDTEIKMWSDVQRQANVKFEQ